MRLGRFYIGWERIAESERIELGLDPIAGGWEVLCIEFAGRGFTLSARRARQHSSV